MIKIIRKQVQQKMKLVSFILEHGHVHCTLQNLSSYVYYSIQYSSFYMLWRLVKAIVNIELLYMPSYYRPSYKKCVKSEGFARHK